MIHRPPQHLASTLPRIVRALGHVRALGLLMLLTAVAVMHTVVFACAHPAASDHRTDDHAAAASADRHDRSTSSSADRSTDAARHATGSGLPSPGDTAHGDTGGVTDDHSDDPHDTDHHDTDHHQAWPTAHGGLHACVFVLAALALSLGLVVVARVGGHNSGAHRRHRLGPRGDARPPPWTVLSLSELSILRV